jgi:hypothetical protein
MYLPLRGYRDAVGKVAISCNGVFADNAQKDVGKQ